MSQRIRRGLLGAVCAFALCTNAFADGMFSDRYNYPAGDGPHSVAVGDLNGDEWLDLAVANIGSDSVSVLLGLGDGTFAAAAHYAGGDVPQSVAIGDVTGDGQNDVITSNWHTGNVSVLVNKYLVTAPPGGP
ncbi:MAG TPA: VCBS repeat-containing protein [Phycisphaerae bacterium]|nr:VCBS repeat-containing protein [Phycisphaerae bacterium]